MEGDMLALAIDLTTSKGLYRAGETLYRAAHRIDNGLADEVDSNALRNLAVAIEAMPLPDDTAAAPPAWTTEAPTDPGRYWGVWRGKGNRPQETRVVPRYGLGGLEIEWAGERWPLAEVVLWGPVIAPDTAPEGWREALAELQEEVHHG